MAVPLPSSNQPSSNHYDELFQENNYLREKIQNLKIVIKQCNQQLATEKVKNNGVETVAKLLQETQQELQATSKQKRALEAAVRNLQNRLSTNLLPSDISIGESDVYIASLCPQTLENLARENVRLRNLLHQCASNEEITELNKTQDITDEPNKKILQLSCENEALQEVNKNREKYDDGENLDIGSNQCIDDIQLDLKNFSIHCTNLYDKLNKIKDDNSCRRKDECKNDSFTPRIETKNNLQETIQEIQELTQQNSELKMKLEEVISMNMRWQEYTKQQNRHIDNLNAKILELESTELHPGINDTLKDATKQIEQCQQEKNLAIQEVTQYKKLIMDLQHSLEEKEAAIKQLQEQLRNLSTGVSMANDKDTVSVLMAQIQICAEDFENERRDRARAQAQLTNTRAQLEQSRKETDRYKAMYQTKCNQLVQPYQHGAYDIPSESQLSSRGHRHRDELVIDGPGSLNLKDYEIADTVNKDKFKSLPATTGRANIEMLCCPKCGCDFSEGSKLLSHIDSCIE